MSYDFTKSNGTPVSVADGAIDTSQFSVGLVGKNVSGYGLTIAQTFVHMLENFANNSAPSNPTQGQLWYDSSSGVDTLKVYNGTSWRSILHQNSTGTYVFDDDVRIEGNLTITGDLLPDADCSGGTGSDIGTSSLRFCDVYAVTFNGTATAATYSDLAERYEADKAYSPGTVVKFGGDKEVTETTGNNEEDTFSVVSTDPGLMLNADAGDADTHPYIALYGRVLVRVEGPVKKFDRLVSSDKPGVATVGTGNVFARALESNNDKNEKLVLCAVKALI